MARDLFSNLLKLHAQPVPKENFFTEVVAWMFAAYPELLYAWVKECLEIDEQYHQSIVETQVDFEASKTYGQDCKPDILITLKTGASHDLLMIESKVSSKEGPDQLLRYAEQLTLAEGSNRYLVYITRDYEPKDAELIKKKYPSVRFFQLRWYQFYQFLERQQSTTMIEEVLKFMQEHEMTKITTITPDKLQAFKFIPELFEYFDAVLYDDIADEFTRVFGKPGKPLEEIVYERYCLTSWVEDWNCQLGFWMPGEEDTLPYVGVTLEINADLGYRRWNNLARKLKQVELESAQSAFPWHGESLDTPNTWATISLLTPMSEILKEINNVDAAKRHLTACLKEAERVKQQYLR